MSDSKNRGLNFGLTSGVITTLGLIVGLGAVISSKLVVIGGILTIAIADAMSDSLGIHVSEESTGINHKEVMKATKFAFLSKFLLPLTFLVPVLLLDLNLAIIVSIFWAFLILFYVNLHIARRTGKKPSKLITEHLVVTVIIIFLTHFVGLFIGKVFG